MANTPTVEAKQSFFSLNNIPLWVTLGLLFVLGLQAYAKHQPAAPVPAPAAIAATTAP